MRNPLLIIISFIVNVIVLSIGYLIDSSGAYRKLSVLLINLLSVFPLALFVALLRHVFKLPIVSVLFPISVNVVSSFSSMFYLRL